MGSYHRQKLVTYVMLWCSGMLTLLVLFDAFSFDLLYIVSFTGFLAIVEAMAPTELSLPWRRRLNWFVTVAFVGFVLLVLRAIVLVVPDEFLPL